jgi:hypothetical protein
MQEQMATREWIIARITSTEEAVASGGDVRSVYLVWSHPADA